MTEVESDAMEIQSAAQVVRLDQQRFQPDGSRSQSGMPEFQSDAPELQSDASEFQSDLPQVQPDERRVGAIVSSVGPAAPGFRANQQLLRLAVTKVATKILLLRLKQRGVGLKVCGIPSDERGIQSAMSRFQSRASLFRLTESFFAHKPTSGPTKRREEPMHDPRGRFRDSTRRTA